MRRYQFRHYLKLSAILLTLGVTCAAQLPEITLRLIHVENVLDEQLVVLDQNDAEVGAVLSAENNLSEITIAPEFDGVPLFLLKMGGTGDNVVGSRAQVFFLSSDCSGMPLITAQTNSVLAPSMFNTVTGEIFVSDQSDAAAIPVGSRLSANGDCETTTESPFVTPALISPVAFTPPFRIVRHGDLPDIWDGVVE